jgi:hypothetical protein
MKKIALIISGRAACYDICLLPMLEKLSFHVDLFISLNDTECFYYDVMKERLSKWLKGIYINPYVFPEGFKCHFNEGDYRYAYQKIDGVWLPRNVLSHFFNDMNAYNMACSYSYENNFEYDIIMKYRSDIISNIADINFDNFDPSKLYSVYPNCMFETFGKHKTSIILQDWHWGSPMIMKVACSTYEYILNENNRLNGQFLFHYESNFADTLLDNGIHNIYIHIPYAVDMNRRIFDSTWKQDDITDSRKVNCEGCPAFVDIHSLKCIEDFPKLTLKPGN